jgi:hypothetical protein
LYGYVVFANGTPVSWSAKKQKIVPQSSCEAETYALNAGCRALIFIKNLLAELNTTVELPMANSYRQRCSQADRNQPRNNCAHQAL